MTTELHELSFERVVNAPLSEAFRAFTVASALREWLCHAAQADPRKGGRFYLWWNYGYYTAGRFTDVVLGERLEFSWQDQDDPAPTTVRVRFQAQDEATVIHLTHSGLGSGPGWPRTIQQIREGWESGLENLQALLETGVDRRFARRPMFGIGGDLLTVARQARLGVPVSEGIWIDNTIEGRGAQAAGLQHDDVMVSLGGRPLTDWASFGMALQHHHAGDRVPVEFYRAGERQTVLVELTPRKLAPIAESASALAAQAQAIYAQMNAEIDDALAGATELAAEYRPEAGEWTAKEILAHLINDERDVHAWIVGIMEDMDIVDVFHANLPQRVQSVVAVYPTLAALVEELKRSEELTATMIALLPPPVESCKHLLFHLGNWITASPIHTREHLNEIRRLVAAATPV